MFIEKVIKNVETMATAYELAKGAVPEIQRIVKRLQFSEVAALAKQLWETC
jgi:hypothetical protein